MITLCCKTIHSTLPKIADLQVLLVLFHDSHEVLQPVALSLQRLTREGMNKELIYYFQACVYEGQIYAHGVKIILVSLKHFEKK